jgi:hypothetical protein
MIQQGKCTIIGKQCTGGRCDNSSVLVEEAATVVHNLLARSVLVEGATMEVHDLLASSTLAEEAATVVHNYWEVVCWWKMGQWWCTTFGKGCTGGLLDKGKVRLIGDKCN